MTADNAPFKLSSTRGSTWFCSSTPGFHVRVPDGDHCFSDRIAEFEKRNCQVIGVSVDSAFSHFAWINTPRKKVVG